MSGLDLKVLKAILCEFDNKLWFERYSKFSLKHLEDYLEPYAPVRAFDVALGMILLALYQGGYSRGQLAVMLSEIVFEGAGQCDIHETWARIINADGESLVLMVSVCANNMTSETDLNIQLERLLRKLRDGVPSN